MFTLNPSSAIPIYRQIIDQTRDLVASGELAAGDKLPSIRAIASDLGINPMTVSKAYSMLDHAGIVSRCRGVGMVVAEGTDGTLVTESAARAVVLDAKGVGMSRTDLLAQIERLWEET
ncbi:MAG: GntR family transcriptional regulator [Gammaproteobacteria bacterium]|nr:GntR family transcriptional regulator [Gammaproteobacteria bacterium]MYJ74457.1 GntR family transcriptional regulator [Gammaproteobacteria bacterium]